MTIMLNRLGVSGSSAMRCVAAATATAKTTLAMHHRSFRTPQALRSLVTVADGLTTDSRMLRLNQIPETGTHTKILCTLGPSSDKEGSVGELVTHGMAIARLNFSVSHHGGVSCMEAVHRLSLYIYIYINL